MRKALSCVLMTVLLLGGCAAGGGAQDSPENLAARIRAEYLNLASWSSAMAVHADYGERVYDFALDAAWEKGGETVLTVTAPELIAGITARLDEDGAYLEYDGASLSIGAISDSGMSALDAVPYLMEQLTGGYMAECAFVPEGEGRALRVFCRDPAAAQGEGTECALYFDPDSHDLLRAEVLRDGFTVLTVEFTNFTKEMSGDDAADRADLG